MQTGLTLLASLACLSGGALAMADSNPYQAIVARNVFGLKDPPPPAPVVEPAKPVPKLTLTGITTLGKTRALMTAPAQAKPGELPKGLQSYILGEGERDGAVEVVSIDPAQGIVTLKLAGESVTLWFPDSAQSKRQLEAEAAAASATLSAAVARKRISRTRGLPQAPLAPAAEEPAQQAPQ